MARRLVLLVPVLLLVLSFGCRRNITRIDGLTPKYTSRGIFEVLGQDLHMAGDDLMWLIGADEPSRLSPDQAFRF